MGYSIEVSPPEVKDFHEKNAVNIEKLTGNALATMFGDRWLYPETEAHGGGILDRLQQHFSVGLGDSILEEGRVNLKEVIGVGQGFAKELDQDNHPDFINLLVASEILRRLAIESGGTVVGEGGQARDIRPIYFDAQRRETYQTSETLPQTLLNELQKYDLFGVINEIETQGDSAERRSRLAVACLFFALSSPLVNQDLPPGQEIIDLEMIKNGNIPITSAEVAHYSGISVQDRAQRKKTEQEIAKKFCNEKFGFEEVYGLYIPYEGGGWESNKAPLKAVAIATAEDQTVFAITDQGEIWRKNGEEKWEPLVIKRQDIIHGEMLSVALSNDLERTGKREVDEAVRVIVKEDEEGIAHTDLRAARTAKAIPPRADTIQFSETELAEFYDHQQKERTETVAKTVLKIQETYGLLESLDETEQREIEIVRQGGRKEKVKAIGKSIAFFQGGKEIPEMAEIDTYPQFFIAEDGQILSQIMVQTDDDRFVVANLNKNRSSLIETEQKAAEYYDTGLNITFLNLEEDDPSEFAWSLKEMPCKKGGASFAWYQFFVDKGSYYPPGTKMLAVEIDREAKGDMPRETPEHFNELSFVTSPVGEVAQVGVKEAATKKPPVIKRGIYAIRVKAGGERLIPDVIIPTTAFFGKFGGDKDSAGRQRRVLLEQTKLKAGLMRRNPGSWTMLQGDANETHKVEAPQGYKFSNGKRATRATMIAQIDDPKDIKSRLLVDVDGNIYRQQKPTTLTGYQPSIILVPEKPEKIFQ